MIIPVHGWHRVVADWQNTAVFASALASYIFIALYSYLAPWWKNSMGRMIVALDLSIALALTPGSIARIWHFQILTDEFFAFFDVMCLSMIPIIIVWRGVILWKIQREVRKERKKRTPLFKSSGELNTKDDIKE